MSPEQISGRPVDPRSDLFSLGTVLYELCTGQHPFHAASVTAYNIVNQPHTPARELDPAISAEFSSLIDQLLEKKPDKRLQSDDALVARLDSLSFPPTPHSARRRRNVAIIASAVTSLVILLVAVIYGVSSSWREPTRHDSRIAVSGRSTGFEDVARDTASETR